MQRILDMQIIELMYGIAMTVLCALAVISDTRDGIIRNRLLLIFTLVGIALDVVYYAFMAGDLITGYLVNVGLVAAVTMYLFYSHSFAGGDCKLSIVLAMLYPGRFYLLYKGSPYTLVLSLCIAILYGYVFFLAASIISLVSGKTQLSAGYIKNYLLVFIKSYAITIIYVSAFNYVLLFTYTHLTKLPTEVMTLMCMLLVWIVNKVKCFRKWQFFLPVLIADILFSIVLKRLPISFNIESYLLVLVLLICQMMIRTGLYEDIEIVALKKGMILSTISSMMMQNSRIKGLPPISSEDLRDRLTDEQVASIKRWSVANGINSITVLRKIPFAIFISLGFLTYFCIWYCLV